MSNLLSSITHGLQKVSGPDKHGWYTALCPFHDDMHHPNLRFKQDGFVCMACATKGSLKVLADKLGFEQATKKSNKKVLATYDYTDENRNLLFQVVRFYPKEFRQRRPDGNGGYLWGIRGVRRVLYRLPELLEAPKDQIVFVAEGEKAVNTLAEHWLTATCSPMGAAKWRDEYSAFLAERDIVVLPDNDEAGESHAQQVAASLSGTAKSIRITRLLGLKAKEDVYDWFTRGNTKSDLEKLLEASSYWEPVKPEQLSQILNGISAFISRFVVLSPSQLQALSLWVLHTHAFKNADITPYISISSAEKRSGKTRLLEVLDLLVSKPWFTGRVTPAVLARKIDAECPTLLLDESDAAFKSDREYSETLRAILNNGYRSGGKSSICVGQGANIGYKDLSTFCPKAIAGIGRLPDTVADRSVPIVLKRRIPEEKVERFRRKRSEAEAKDLKQRISDCLASTRFEGIEPYMPDELNDRAADCWEPLFTIAQLAGEEWLEKARKASIELMTNEVIDNESLGVQLLKDIKDIFEGENDRISSSDLVKGLKDLEESPWNDLKGKPITPRRLASMLKGYGIYSQTIREGDHTPRGYYRCDFKDTWNRYLPNIVLQSATSATISFEPIVENTQNLSATKALKTQNVADNSQSYTNRNVADVADKKGGRGHLQKNKDKDDDCEVLEIWRRISIPEWRKILRVSIETNDTSREEYARSMLKEVLHDPEYKEPQI